MDARAEILRELRETVDASRSACDVITEHVALHTTVGQGARLTDWAPWIVRLAVGSWNLIAHELAHGELSDVVSAVRGLVSIIRPWGDTAPRTPDWRDTCRAVSAALDDVGSKYLALSRLVRARATDAGDLTAELRQLAGQYPPAGRQ